MESRNKDRERPAPETDELSELSEQDGEEQLRDQPCLALAARFVLPADVHEEPLVHQAFPDALPCLRIVGNAVVDEDVDREALRHLVAVGVLRRKVGVARRDAVEEVVVAVFVSVALVAETVV